MSTKEATSPESALPYEDGPEPEHGHVLPLDIYLKVFGALIFLTLVTVGVSYAGLGRAAIAVAMLVAAIKAGFVVGYFMHLKYDLRFYSLLFFGSLIFIALFFGLTMVDLNTRDSLNLEEGTFAKQKEAWDRLRAEQWKKAYEKIAPRRAAVPRPDPMGAAPASAPDRATAPAPDMATTPTPTDPMGAAPAPADPMGAAPAPAPDRAAPARN